MQMTSRTPGFPKQHSSGFLEAAQLQHMRKQSDFLPLRYYRSVVVALLDCDVLMMPMRRTLVSKNKIQKRNHAADFVDIGVLHAFLVWPSC